MQAENHIIEFLYHCKRNNIYNLRYEHISVFFQNEINSFLKEFQLRIQDRRTREVNKFWEIIYKNISGFLIQKAHLKNICDRYSCPEKFYDPKREEIEIKNGEYINLTAIHRGSSSTIQLIYYIKTEEIFALKQLDDPIEKVGLFNRERANYKQMRHPFLAQYYGTVQVYNYHGLAIEYINGHMLDHIKELKLNDECKIKIIFEILAVMKYFYDHGYIFRDLKPSNIMIDQFQTVVLIDLDRMVKKNECNESTTEDLCSSFIAPEILERRAISIESDIFSFGLLIYFIFSENQFKIELGKKKLNLNFDVFPEKFKTLRKICEQCIEIDPSKRINYSDLFLLFYFEYFASLSNNYSRHFQKTVNFFSYAADQNNEVIAQLFLAGFYIKSQKDKSFYYINLAANNGDSLAQMVVGFQYFLGQDIPKDINKSIHYLTLSSQQNNKYAQGVLGKIFQTTKNDYQAMNYYIKSEKQGLTLVQSELGKLYYKNGYIDESLQILNQAEDRKAKYYLGLIYYNGEKIPRDIKKAIHYFQLAAYRNHRDSLFYLGLIYYLGDGVPKDVNKAIHYLTCAASRNEKYSQFLLGKIYFKAVDVEKNIRKSFFYFTVSAELNNIESQFFLGYMYYKGCDNDNNYIDINKSIHYFSLAANQFDVDSSFYLGVIYSENKYVPLDMNKAIKYYKNASSFNNQYSKNNLAVIYKVGFTVDKNISYAIELLNEGINYENDRVCMYNLAHIYFFDLNDVNNAINLLIKAYKNNFKTAKKLLSLCLLEKLKNEPSISFESIEIELNRIHIVEKSMLHDIYQYIRESILIENYNFDSLYKRLKGEFYVYNFDYDLINSLYFFSQDLIVQCTRNCQSKDIDCFFYEGFSC